MIFARLCLLLVLALVSCTPYTSTPHVSLSPASAKLRLEPHFRGLTQPTDLRFLGDGRALATEQRGRIVLLGARQGRPRTVLDVRQSTGCCGERGLLSLALHPDFRRNGLVFLYRSLTSDDTVLSRVRLDPRTLEALPQSHQTLLRVKQPGPTHNGGQLQFGPDGHLYLSLGDGLYRPSWLGALSSAQERGRLLGKLLRFAVSADGALSVPDDNPFVARAGAKGAIWALGLRNPWRFSFDTQTGELFLTDVGETRFEEVNVQTLEAAKGANYGWPRAEGTHCRVRTCEGFAAPEISYPSREGCAITGGYIYRGKALPELSGTYLYGDYCIGVIWGAGRRGGVWHTRELLDSPLLLSSFAQDAAGEIYALDYATGSVHRLVRAR